MSLSKISNAYKFIKTRIKWGSRFNQLGARTSLGKKRLCNSPNSISIDHHTVIGDDWVLADLAPNLQNDGPKIEIGNWCRIQHDFQCNAYTKVSVGDYCLFAPRVFISDADHAPDSTSAGISLSPKFLSEPVEIGDNCWLGVNTTILKGVTLGPNCTVAAGAVVTKSFPENSIIGGVPAKLIGKNEPL